MKQKSEIEISNIEGQIIKTIYSNDTITTIDIWKFIWRGLYNKSKNRQRNCNKEIYKRITARSITSCKPHAASGFLMLSANKPLLSIRVQIFKSSLAFKIISCKG